MKTQELICKQEWYNNGQLSREEYWLNGNWHNPAGPAYREWYDNGQLLIEQYRLNDKLHNPAGPAYRSWRKNGQLKSEKYWLYGEHLTKEQWEKRINNRQGKTVLQHKTVRLERL